MSRESNQGRAPAAGPNEGTIGNLALQSKASPQRRTIPAWLALKISFAAVASAPQ